MLHTPQVSHDVNYLSHAILLEYILSIHKSDLNLYSRTWWDLTLGLSETELAQMQTMRRWQLCWFPGTEMVDRHKIR